MSNKKSQGRTEALSAMTSADLAALLSTSGNLALANKLFNANQTADNNKADEKRKRGMLEIAERRTIDAEAEEVRLREMTYRVIGGNLERAERDGLQSVAG